MRLSPILSAALLLPLTAACGGTTSGPEENSAPTVSIISPAAGTTFTGGVDLAIQLEGSDAQDGTLSGARLSWWALLHHASHTHPFLPSMTG
ncbi:MAG: hypothetical protein OEO79_17930, partial [Gemmatimonadota bacterium]|nr:hypothetical protein [Gemmatimonadota bacterium]